MVLGGGAAEGGRGLTSPMEVANDHLLNMYPHKKLEMNQTNKLDSSSDDELPFIVSCPTLVSM